VPIVFPFFTKSGRHTDTEGTNLRNIRWRSEYLEEAPADSLTDAARILQLTPPRLVCSAGSVIVQCSVIYVVQ